MYRNTQSVNLENMKELKNEIRKHKEKIEYDISMFQSDMKRGIRDIANEYSESYVQREIEKIYNHMAKIEREKNEVCFELDKKIRIVDNVISMYVEAEYKLKKEMNLQAIEVYNGRLEKVNGLIDEYSRYKDLTTDRSKALKEDTLDGIISYVKELGILIEGENKEVFSQMTKEEQSEIVKLADQYSTEEDILLKEEILLRISSLFIEYNEDEIEKFESKYINSFEIPQILEIDNFQRTIHEDGSITWKYTGMIEDENTIILGNLIAKSKENNGELDLSMLTEKEKDCINALKKNINYVYILQTENIYGIKTQDYLKDTDEMETWHLEEIKLAEEKRIKKEIENIEEKLDIYEKVRSLSIEMTEDMRVFEAKSESGTYYAEYQKTIENINSAMGHVESFYGQDVLDAYNFDMDADEEMLYTRYVTFGSDLVSETKIFEGLKDLYVESGDLESYVNYMGPIWEMNSKYRRMSDELDDLEMILMMLGICASLGTGGSAGLLVELGLDGLSTGVSVAKGDAVGAVAGVAAMVAPGVSSSATKKATSEAAELAGDLNLEKISGKLDEIGNVEKIDEIGEIVGNNVGVVVEGTSNLVPNMKNLDDFANGLKTFDEVADDLALKYAEIVNSNKKWSWMDDVPGAEGLTKSNKDKIRELCVQKGLIPDVGVVTKVVNGKTVRYADFKSAGVVQETFDLPKHLWGETDIAQFKYLDELMGGRPANTTWHHSPIDGKMELVPFGIHNITNHNGGRTIGHWAYRVGGRN